MTLKQFLCKSFVLSFILMLTSVMAYAENPAAEEVKGKSAAGPYNVNRIKADQAGEAFIIRIQGNRSPTFTVYEAADPKRVVLDIAEGNFDESVNLPLHFTIGPVAQLQGQVLDDNKKPGIARLEMSLAEGYGYSAQRENNDVVVTFQKEASVIHAVEIEKKVDKTHVFLKANGQIKNYEKGEADKTGSLPNRLYLDIKDVIFTGSFTERLVGTSLEKVRIAKRGRGIRVVFDSGLQDLFPYDIVSRKEGLEVIINSSPTSAVRIANLKKINVPKKPATEMALPVEQDKPKEVATAVSLFEDNFSNAGYNKQRITVDFYKIDLHNVFRLFGEISGLNIVVEESVAGSLTLALNDVPWDFALDIILNLKDLQKEERFNTLVISPKSKVFTWPETKAEQLQIKADPLSISAGTASSKEGISIKKQLETPKEVVEAKKLMVSARAMERQEKLDEALGLYEEAYTYWPDNNNLANRIASLFLVHKGMNAKAVYYAKSSLKNNETDRTAALYAAIGLANMRKNKEAKEYFVIATRDYGTANKPSSEALTSYAAFDEENGNYMEALLLLTRHDDLYGETLETMIAKARIYDKEGNSEKAAEQYRSILLSGYKLPPDLNKYIKNRVSGSTTSK